MNRPSLMPVYTIIALVACVVIIVLAYQEKWWVRSGVSTGSIPTKQGNSDVAVGTPTIELLPDELPAVGESIVKDGYTITNEGIDSGGAGVTGVQIDLSKIPTPAYTAIPWKPDVMDKTAYDQVVAKLEPLIARIAKQIAGNKKNGTQTFDTDAWLDIALYHNALGDKEGAEAIWVYLTQASPGLVQPYGNLASMHMAAQEWDKAVPLYKKAISLMPKMTQYYQDLADIYVAQKNTASAMAILREGSAADTTQWNLLVTLGRLYRAQGAVADANKTFDEAIARAKKAGNTAAVQAIEQEKVLVQ